MAKSTYDSTKDFDKLADNYLETCGRLQTKLPKVSEFCREFLGGNEDTVNLWLTDETKDTENLKDAIQKVKETQKHILMDDGLYGGREVNQAMAIFLLKANHEMVETSRQELVGKDGQPLQFSFKVDLAGGYIPQLGGILTTPATGTTGSSSVQGFSVAPQSPKDDNSDNGSDKTGSI